MLKIEGVVIFGLKPKVVKLKKLYPYLKKYINDNWNFVLYIFGLLLHWFNQNEFRSEFLKLRNDNQFSGIICLNSSSR